MHTDSMLDALDGLSVGDAVGWEFPLMRGTSVSELPTGTYPAGRWRWTDDTEMACSVVAELLTHSCIEQDRLATAFAQRCDPARDYGFATVGNLRQIRDGAPWREVSAAAFEGRGSCGNGAAMRVAPLGAYFAGDPDRIVAEAIRSAEVTHMHPEAALGAAAVALAAGHAAQARRTGTRPAPADFLTAILHHLDDSETTRLIHRAHALLGASTEKAAGELGNGSRVLIQDTVPFTLWAAATHLHDYPTAITTCLEADGDIDTTSAITGGIVAAYTGGTPSGIPANWLTAREPLPRWFESARQTRQRKPAGFRRISRWLTPRRLDG